MLTWFSGWASPSLLGWAAAALVPLLIHLWSRQRRRVVDWGATRLLAAALRRQAGRLRLEWWTLLLLRMLPLGLLAIAAADPGLARPGLDGAAAAGTTHWIIVLDASYSMEHRGAGRGRFEAARRAARQLAADARDGDGFSLLLLEAPPRTLIGEPTFDSGDLLRELERARSWPGGADLAAALSTLDGLVDQGGRRRAIARTVVVFLTDLGANTWRPLTETMAREQWERLESRAELRLVDVGDDLEEGHDNRAIVALRLESPTPLVGRESRAAVSVRSFGGKSSVRDTLQLLLDGRVVGERPLAVADEGEQTLTLPFRVESAGEHLLEARLSDDSLAIDNQRWLVVTARPSLPVLCVEGRPGDARAVAIALNPYDEPGTAPSGADRGTIDVQIVPDTALLERELSRHVLVILCDARIGAPEAEALSRYVRQGGGLLVFPGPSTDAEALNSLWFDKPAERLLPARLGEPVSGELLGFDPLGYQHPVTRPFREHERAGLVSTPTWRYLRLQPPRAGDGAPSREVLRFTDGAPALLESRVGGGACYLFATAAALDATWNDAGGRRQRWSELAVWPSFPPLLHGILATAVAAQSTRQNSLVGAPLSGPTPPGSRDGAKSDDGIVSLRLPDQGVRRLLASADGARWTLDRAEQAGVYVAFRAVDEAGAQRFAVNIDTAESDLTRLPADSLPAALRAERPAVEGAERPVTRRRSLAGPLLAAVFGLLLVELLVARRAGSGLR